MNGCSALVDLKSLPLKTRNPPGGIIVGAGTRYFFGVSNSSVRNQPPISAGAEERFCNSTHATALPCGRVRASLITTFANWAGAPSGCPGVPLKTEPARQLDWRFNLSADVASSF